MGCCAGWARALASAETGMSAARGAEEVGAGGGAGGRGGGGGAEKLFVATETAGAAGGGGGAGGVTVGRVGTLAVGGTAGCATGWE